MANGDASSSDSAPSLTNRPAMQQFKKQKEQAAVEGTVISTMPTSPGQMDSQVFNLFLL